VGPSDGVTAAAAAPPPPAAGRSARHPQPHPHRMDHGHAQSGGESESDSDEVGTEMPSAPCPSWPPPQPLPSLAPNAAATEAQLRQAATAALAATSSLGTGRPPAQSPSLDNNQLQGPPRLYSETASEGDEGRQQQEEGSSQDGENGGEAGARGGSPIININLERGSVVGPNAAPVRHAALYPAMREELGHGLHVNRDGGAPRTAAGALHTVHSYSSLGPGGLHHMAAQQLDAHSCQSTAPATMAAAGGDVMLRRTQVALSMWDHLRTTAATPSTLYVADEHAVASHGGGHAEAGFASTTDHHRASRGATPTAAGHSDAGPAAPPVQALPQQQPPTQGEAPLRKRASVEASGAGPATESDVAAPEPAKRAKTSELNW
jgi:hypothetical protein